MKEKRDNRPDSTPMSDRDWEYQDVDTFMDGEYARALAEFREARAGEAPEYIAKLPRREAVEGAFEAGFIAASRAFWKPVDKTRGDERRFKKVPHAASRQRSEDAQRGEDEVRSLAMAYRRSNPEESTRGMALHIGNRLGRSPGTVRSILYRLKIK